MCSTTVPAPRLMCVTREPIGSELIAGRHPIGLSRLLVVQPALLGGVLLTTRLLSLTHRIPLDQPARCNLSFVRDRTHDETGATA